VSECPKCFDPRDWEAYQRLCQESGCEWDASRYCRDCNQATKERRVAEGRCEHPETVFVLRRGEYVGLRADDPGWRAAVVGNYAGTGLKSKVNFIAPAGRDAVSKAATEKTRSRG
jgi:hypothetical protein